MVLFRILILISKCGNTLQSVIDSCSEGSLKGHCEVVGVISDNNQSDCLSIAEEHGIHQQIVLNIEENKEALIRVINNFSPDIVINDMLETGHEKGDLSEIDAKVIQAKPSEIVLEETLAENKSMEIEVQSNFQETPIYTSKVPIFEDDNVDIVNERITRLKGGAIVGSLRNILWGKEKNTANISKDTPDIFLIDELQNRDIYDVGYGYCAIVEKDALFSNGKYICDLPWKGAVETSVSEFWFAQTRNIIMNHYVDSSGNVTVVRSTTPIPVKIKVYGYLTGDLYRFYKSGLQNKIYSRNNIPRNLSKNQLLSEAVVLIEHQGNIITPKQLVDDEICTGGEWDIMLQTARELYSYGCDVCADCGLILAATEYEFAIDDKTEEVLLVGKCHTLENSTFFQEETYFERFERSMSPESLYTGVIENYILAQGTKSSKEKEIPQKQIDKAIGEYKNFVNILFENDGAFAEIKAQEGAQLARDSPVEWINEWFLSEYWRVVVLVSHTENEEDLQDVYEKLKSKQIFCIKHIVADSKQLKDIAILYSDQMGQNDRNVIFFTIERNSTDRELSTEFFEYCPEAPIICSFPDAHYRRPVISIDYADEFIEKII